jgi:hypothetical protein
MVGAEQIIGIGNGSGDRFRYRLAGQPALHRPVTVRETNAPNTGLGIACITFVADIFESGRAAALDIEDDNLSEALACLIELVRHGFSPVSSGTDRARGRPELHHLTALALLVPRRVRPSCLLGCVLRGRSGLLFAGHLLAN